VVELLLLIVREVSVPPGLVEMGVQHNILDVIVIEKVVPGAGVTVEKSWKTNLRLGFSAWTRLRTLR